MTEHAPDQIPPNPEVLKAAWAAIRNGIKQAPPELRLLLESEGVESRNGGFQADTNVANVAEAYIVTLPKTIKAANPNLPPEVEVVVDDIIHQIYQIHFGELLKKIPPLFLKDAKKK